ncbi:hypothetical protein GCM10023258_30220 [Terrabacter aeriphilus]|uniref:Endonuclease/exonuclease/phosphatase domain-containing protein n=1 Tax=Terrabacter aeriphilus TaxID=515662 RepID=A0ABP9JHG5_9MICO
MVRLGTWNLDTAQPDMHRPLQANWLRQHADVWMLTEVHEVALEGLGSHVVSDAIEGMARRYWSGIASLWPLHPVVSGHPTLVLARVRLPGLGRVLVASSVLPWRAAGKYWPSGDGDDLQGRYASVLSRHQAAILEAREDDLVVWGGDFNQTLSGTEHVGSSSGRRTLGAAFQSLDLRVLTEDAPSTARNAHPIDHVAVPHHVGPVSARCILPTARDRALSDHPAYLAEVGPRATGCHHQSAESPQDVQPGPTLVNTPQRISAGQPTFTNDCRHLNAAQADFPWYF